MTSKRKRISLWLPEELLQRFDPRAPARTSTGGGRTAAIIEAMELWLEREHVCDVATSITDKPREKLLAEDLKRAVAVIRATRAAAKEQDDERAGESAQLP